KSEERDDQAITITIAPGLGRITARGRAYERVRRTPMGHGTRAAARRVCQMRVDLSTTAARKRRSGNRPGRKRRRRAHARRLVQAVVRGDARVRGAASALCDSVARMRVGVPRETAAGEARVALVPDVIPRLDGIDVAVERGAGLGAGFADEAYAQAGAELV